MQSGAPAHVNKDESSFSDARQDECFVLYLNSRAPVPFSLDYYILNLKAISVSQLFFTIIHYLTKLKCVGLKKELLNC